MEDAIASRRLLKAWRMSKHLQSGHLTEPCSSAKQTEPLSNMGKPLKPRQEKLAKALATGATLAVASKKAGYKGNPSSAHNILKKVKISERVEELRAIAEEKLELSRQEYLKTAWSRYIELAPDHPVTAKYGEMVAKAQGWNEPDKVELNGGMDIIVKIGGKPTSHY